MEGQYENGKKKFFTSLKQPLSNLQMLRSSPTTASLTPVYKSLLTLHQASKGFIRSLLKGVV
jgi:hypothetical protein